MNKRNIGSKSKIVLLGGGHCHSVIDVIELANIDNIIIIKRKN